MSFQSKHYTPDLTLENHGKIDIAKTYNQVQTSTSGKSHSFSMNMKKKMQLARSWMKIKTKIKMLKLMMSKWRNQRKIKRIYYRELYVMNKNSLLRNSRRGKK